MPGFREVLGAVNQQMTPWEFDIIVIDSGSSDETVSYARGQPNVRVISISPEQFGHGRTRNQAIAETSAPFIAMLTHDAQPVDSNWLLNLVSAVEQGDEIAGAFGRHVAYPWADPFTKRDLERHFSGFLEHPLVVSKDTCVDKYERDVGWRQFLHFFSDNNSCLRRSVWERIPYPDVEFAEDQIWAKQIIERGYSKIYAPDAAVYHSHDFGLFEKLQRSFDESRNFEIYFGYHLAGSIRQCIRSCGGLSAADLRYGFQEAKTPVSNIEIVRRLFSNIMLVSGHYLGSKNRYIPLKIQKILSRDHKIFHENP